MKNVHVINNDKFTDSYICFINKKFDQNDHAFIVLGKGIGEKITPFKNVFEEKRAIPALIRLVIEMYSSQKIHLHGLFFPQVVLFLFLQPWLLKKCNWFIWGGDLYCFREERISIKDKIYELIRRIVIKNMRFITSVTEGDYQLAVDWYKTKAKYQHGLYINSVKKEYFDKLLRLTSEDKHEIYIQVGNSGDPSNKHIEVLYSLKNFKHENIKLFLPLSYGGSENYIREVISIGGELYGDKFVPLTNFLSADEYAKYLSSIDIAIFNNDRQQGLFNIVSLLYLDKKIYIRSDISSWSFLVYQYQMQIYNTLDLDGIAFCKFIEKVETDNREKVEKLFDDNYLGSVWRSIFDENSA